MSSRILTQNGEGVDSEVQAMKVGDMLIDSHTRRQKELFCSSVFCTLCRREYLCGHYQMSVEFRPIMKRDFNCVSRLYRRCVCGCLLSEGITSLSYRLMNCFALRFFAPCAVGVSPNIHSNIHVIYNLKFTQYAVGELHKIVRK